MKKQITVTKTFLPPLEEFNSYLKRIWECNQVTNNGPLINELEQRLKDYLGVKHLFFVSNGTIAIQIAIKALGLSGDIITTPFSYVATTSSIVWEGCTPVFADIDERTLCIDPQKIENLITSNTSAILATHVYGFPCFVEEIQKIAQDHKLKIIYDAAHAFGVRYKELPLLSFGDVSTISFHATKLFHTVEGGAVITEDDDIAQQISSMRNFGHQGYEDFSGLGINGKNSEIHAAMGLCILPKIDQIIFERKKIINNYKKCLVDTRIRIPIPIEGTQYNYAYFPVIFNTEDILLRIISKLNQNEIFPRRYFYPSLNELPYLTYQQCPISEKLSKQVLCLPLYNGLTDEQISEISRIILDNL